MTSIQARAEQKRNAMTKAKFDAKEAHNHLHKDQKADDKKNNHYCDKCDSPKEQDDCCS